MQTRSWQLGRMALGLASLGAAAILLAGCGSTTEPKAPSASTIAAELAQTQGKGSGGTGGPAGTTRTSEGGSVTIEVTWENPGDGGRPTFSVAMDTHSVNLDGYDLSQLALLRNDRGQEVSPERWEAPAGGHHRSGVLTFPAKDGSGRPVLGPGVGSFELLIRDVAGIKERVLRWEVSR